MKKRFNRIKIALFCLLGVISPVVMKTTAYAETWNKKIKGAKTGDINEIVENTGGGWVNTLSTFAFFGGVALIIGGIAGALIQMSSNKGDGGAWHAGAIVAMIGVVMCAIKIVVASIVGGWNW